MCLRLTVPCGAVRYGAVRCGAVPETTRFSEPGPELIRFSNVFRSFGPAGPLLSNFIVVRCRLAGRTFFVGRQTRLFRPWFRFAFCNPRRGQLAYGGLEGIFGRQYALSGGHLAGRILFLRACSACPPGLDCGHRNGLAGDVNCQILPRGGCRTDSRYWRGSRYRTVPDPGLLWPPEGRPAAAGEEYTLSSRMSGAGGGSSCRQIFRPRGARMYLWRIGGRGGSATGRTSGVFGARTRCPRRGDGAGI